MNKLIAAVLFAVSGAALAQNEGPIDCPDYRKAYKAGMEYTTKVAAKHGITPLVPVVISAEGLDWLLVRKARVNESCWIAINKEFTRGAQDHK